MLDYDLRHKGGGSADPLGGPPGKRISAAIYIHDLSPGGVERQSLVLARELQARDVDVTLVVHQRRGELLPLLPEGVPVVDLRTRRTLQDVSRLKHYLRDARPDVLMANVDHNNIAAALGKRLAGTGTKLVIPAQPADGQFSRHGELEAPAGADVLPPAVVVHRPCGGGVEGNRGGTG